MPDPPNGRDRLRAATRPRLSRAQVVVGVLLGALGFAGAAQVHAAGSDQAYAGARRQDLVLLLDSLESAMRRTTAQIADLEQTRRELAASSDRQDAALVRAREQLQVLGVLAGTVRAVGPGVEITIEDPALAISSATLLNAVEELRDAGAEAIEVNDTARVVAQTALVDTPSGAVLVGGEPVRPPYRLEAIGAPHTLSEAVIFPGGLRDEVAALGGSVEVQRVPALRIDSLHVAKPPQYAAPTPGSG